MARYTIRCGHCGNLLTQLDEPICPCCKKDLRPDHYEATENMGPITMSLLVIVCAALIVCPYILYQIYGKS